MRVLREQKKQREFPQMRDLDSMADSLRATIFAAIRIGAMPQVGSKYRRHACPDPHLREFLFCFFAREHAH